MGSLGEGGAFRCLLPVGALRVWSGAWRIRLDISQKQHLSVGLGGFGPERLNLKVRLQQFLHTAGIGVVEKMEQHGYYLPISVREEGFVKDRFLLAGDAAGFVDPVTGEGITYALLSGQGAARSLIKGGLVSEAVEAAYLSELEEDGLRELRWGRLLGVLLYRSARVRTLLFRQYGRQLTEAFADIIIGEKSYASLCKKHMGLRRFFRLVKGLGRPRGPRARLTKPLEFFTRPMIILPSPARFPCPDRTIAKISRAGGEEA